ncbi:MAG: Lrp/AsnC family transcriptional regulator [Rhizobiales bacterium]|nr:Lrp/AsnC family transcriptional regulator [Hyphomicrobiales bacterium]
MLDALDRKLLTLLQLDSRRTNAELAAEVGLSVSACAKRTARYWADGLIANTPAVLDHRRFRRPVTAIVTVTLVTPTAQMSERFTAEILKFDEVQQCHAVTGDYGFLLLVQERSIEDFTPSPSAPSARCRACAPTRPPSCCGPSRTGTRCRRFVLPRLNDMAPMKRHGVPMNRRSDRRADHVTPDGESPRAAACRSAQTHR